MSVLVVTDMMWDNVPILKKRLESLEEGTIINCLYTPQLESIQKICNNSGLHILRRCLDLKDKENGIVEICKTVNCVMIFTNFLEYNTVSSFVLDLCNINELSHVIFRENTCGFIINDNYQFSKFTPLIRSMLACSTKESLIKCPEITIEKFKPEKTQTPVESVINRLRSNYEGINKHREERSIKLLYDKNEQKSAKAMRKQMKEISFLDYSTKKQVWLKEINHKM